MQSLRCYSLNLHLFNLFILILIQVGCVKDEPAMESPVIITNLSDGDAFERGSLITIHIDIEENQTGIITEVAIFINNREVSAAQDFPCYYEWNSADEETGYHILRLTSTDSDSNLYSDEYSIRLYDMNRQPCPGAETVTDWDGNRYNTIQIGDQCWMKENLKAIHYADGTPLVDGNGTAASRYDTTTKYYFIYNDDTSYIETYGLLYIWKAAVNGYSSELDLNPSQIQGVCPDGWHLPSDSEWKELEMYLGMSQEEANDRDWRGTIEGGMLKETGTSHWAFPNRGSTNESGFTALPGGNRSIIGEYEHLGERGSFWTSTNHIATNNTHNPAYRRLHYEEYRTWRYQGFHDYLTYARSVRCVKNE